ncbi:MAG: GNAT family N-acetyltransferase [Erysipelotrichaceae bacterium]|nr:GNAT family N-acetyltransferase [Erysipelotrichaceae bacterium]
MTYRAKEKDRDRILHFLQFNKTMNLFAIEDIINCKIDSKNLQVYLDREEKFNIVYTLYYDHLVISGKKDSKIDLDFIKKLDTKGLIGDYAGDDELICGNIIDGYYLQKAYLLSLDKLLEEVDTSEVVKGEDRDIDQLVESEIKVFKNKINVDAYKDEIRNNSKRFHIIKKDGKIISAASTSAESTYSAMIVGVFTLEEYRNNGYAKKVVISLCKELINENKTCCLFFDNPIAGNMYRKIGFKDAGIYSIMRKRND